MNSIIAVIMFLIISGCKNPDQPNTLSPNMMAKGQDSINKRYCFSEIKDSLIKANILTLFKGQIIYKKIDKAILLKDKRIKPLSGKVIEFYEFTFFTDSYIMKYQNKEFLIMIGQAAGATGVGVDYWNYRCYSLNSSNFDMVMPEFASLVKTPFSIFIDTKGEIDHLEIEHNYPRPTDDKEVKLNYMPLLIHVFKGDKNFTIEFKCRNKE